MIVFPKRETCARIPRLSDEPVPSVFGLRCYQICVVAAIRYQVVFVTGFPSVPVLMLPLAT